MSELEIENLSASSCSWGSFATILDSLTGPIDLGTVGICMCLRSTYHKTLLYIHYN